MAKVRIIEESENVGERGFRLVEEREERVPKDVLHAWPPGVGPDLLEGLDQSRGEEGPGGRSSGGKWVEAKDVRGIGNVEIHEIVSPLGRDSTLDLLGEVPMRIEQGKAVP
jgi:hypothetical protein